MGQCKSLTSLGATLSRFPIHIADFPHLFPFCALLSCDVHLGAPDKTQLQEDVNDVETTGSPDRNCQRQGEATA